MRGIFVSAETKRRRSEGSKGGLVSAHSTGVRCPEASGLPLSFLVMNEMSHRRLSTQQYNIDKYKKQVLFGGVWRRRMRRALEHERIGLRVVGAVRAMN